ncbi:MAG: response regulator [Clostridia bacterium]|nr:ATP-binding protein [Lachnospiraceae bacterium]NCC00861.1 response regulator [Clostridia bacterium]NCD02091.1 response regulator [Clostridia bacterium]
MTKQQPTTKNHRRRSIFRALFVPLIIVMILQSAIFYFAAVYGGIEESLSQNAADILTERLLNRKNEIEDAFNNQWTDLDSATAYFNHLYSEYELEYGAYPFRGDSQHQIQFLEESSDKLIETLRQNNVNGVYIILNDKSMDDMALVSEQENKYGICIRDTDQMSNYTNREDLLLERSPTSIIEKTGCALDSWWESQYTFNGTDDGGFYYEPLQAVLQNPDTDGEDLAYFSSPYKLNGNGQEVVSFSIPLISDEGYPYGVIGVELTTKYLSSLIPGTEINEPEKSCYVLALQDIDNPECDPIVSNGALFNRCFDSNSMISTSNTVETGGFTLTARGDIKLYGTETPITIYNNNNPFENRQLVLIALVEHDTMFSYLSHIKNVLLFVSLFSLFLGIICILIVSRHFASPITALATRVRNRKPEDGFNLGHLGITEIDQLVDSIEDLNENVSKNIARTEFFSRMSHDMRTPMNAIISFSSPELLEGADEDLKDNYLDQIHTSGQYLLGLINEVLDMTKIESKKTDLQYEPMLLQHAWDTTIPIIDKLAQKKNITFERNTADCENAYVIADEQHLNQIVINLLSNAVKFTPPGGHVRLNVQLASDSKNKNFIQCHILIQDNGIGISQEFMKNLYTPFEQEHEGREGTGLGLSIAKKLVELMKGTIQCESIQGEGTTFKIMLPLEKCKASDAAQFNAGSATPSEKKLPTSDTLEGKHILVCEDHPMNTQIIRRLLERKGIQVVTAPNGKAGLNIFTASALNDFDAILMDIRMPVMDGLATAAAIRSLDREDALDIPIIAMTANAFDEDVRASHNAGMNAHLSKPVEPDKLYGALEKFLLEK